MRTLKVTAVLLFAAACAPSSPGPRAPEPARSTVRLTDFDAVEFLTEGDLASASFGAVPADVWAILPGIYETLGIPIGGSSPELMKLGNPGFRARRVDGKRMGQYLDCGITPSGVLADVYDVTLTIATQVVKGSEGGAVVTTTMDAWAEPRMTRGDPIHCRSKGTLEQRVAEMVAEKLGTGGITPSSASSVSEPGVHGW